MIIKRVGLKKLNINGAKCLFDKAELILRREQICLNPKKMHTDWVNQWDIEVENAKCHVNFDLMFELNAEMNLKFETIEGDKLRAEGIVDGVTSIGTNYEEIDMRVKNLWG